MSDRPLVSVRGLRVVHRRAGLFARTETTAVDDIGFDIARGDTLALVGESGCGKTTAARAILRLIDTDAGTVAYDGTDLLALRGEALRRHRRHMQIVFQDPFTSLNPRHTVGAIIAEGLIVHGLARGVEAQARVSRLLDEVGLSASDASRYPHELSGGQRQRVAIARALAVDPEFLVLDEAVSSLDATTQAQVLALITQLRQARALTCLFIAHNLAVVQSIATSVAVMYQGRIVERAPVKAIFAAPAHPYTRAMLDAVPVSDPRDRRTRTPLAGDPGTAGDAGGTTPGCAFFPRCPHPAKDAACTTARPALHEVAPGHLAACIKPRANLEIM
jgi:oligopeptide/dipeptide ABC transporter ATP-binding protein